MEKKNLKEYNLFSNNIMYKHIYVRDSNGLLIEALVYKNGILDDKSLYSYDFQGNNTKMIHYNNSATFLYSETTYSYFGNTEEVSYKNFGNTSFEHYKYIYEYDVKGNWIKRTKLNFDNNSQKKEVTERDFIYL